MNIRTKKRVKELIEKIKAEFIQTKEFKESAKKLNLALDFIFSLPEKYRKQFDELTEQIMEHFTIFNEYCVSYMLKSCD